MPVPIQPLQKVPVLVYLPMILFRVLVRILGERTADSPFCGILRNLWKVIGRLSKTADVEDLDVVLNGSACLTHDKRCYLTDVKKLDLELYEPMKKEAFRLREQADLEKIMSEQKKKKKGKYFKIRLDTENLYENPPGSVFTKYALQEPLIQIARHYLNCPIRLHSTELHLDFPIEGEPVSSQNWHYDGLDFHLVKVFTYLEDVTEETGCLSLIDTEMSQYWRHRIAKRPEYSSRGRQRQELVDKLIPKGKQHNLYGPAGMVIIADTAMVLHRGMPQKTKSRFMFVATYTSLIPFEEWPFSRYRKKYIR